MTHSSMLIKPNIMSVTRSPLSSVSFGLSSPKADSARSTTAKIRGERVPKNKNSSYVEEITPDYVSRDSEFFVWKKKLEKEGKVGLTGKELKLLQKRKVADNLNEIQSIKKRREERDRRIEEIREDRQMMQREKEKEYYEKWHSAEDKFFLNQAKLRSQIRRQQGRAKPIDALAFYVEAVSFPIKVEIETNMQWLKNPIDVLSSGRLSDSDIEDLLEDIKVYKKVQRGECDVLWNAISTVSKFRLRHTAELGTRTLDPAIEGDISKILSDKNEYDLVQLETKVRGKLLENNVDVSYWENMLLYIENAKCESYINHVHASSPVTRNKSQVSVPTQKMTEHNCDKKLFADSERANRYESTLTRAMDVEVDDLIPGDDGETMDYSAQNLDEGAVLRAGHKIIDPEQDKINLLRARQRVLNIVESNEEKLRPNSDISPEDTRKTILGCDVNCYLHEMGFHPDQFCTRKPRFLNKVNTGFVWNKYNRTHYDRDNPPPKMVMGYRFTVFYPDLIDKSKVPTVTLYPCERSKGADLSEPEMAILRISAGPPYEDVAFKVVNKEWDRSWKSGYKCAFQKDTFHLWFRFKRMCYRR